MTNDEVKEMTNEEVKEIIIKERDSLKANPLVKVEDCLYEAFNIAVKLLEQQPCKDAISRQAAINAITKIHPVDTEYDCTLYDKVDVMYVLKDLPPVTPQPKTGRWIKKGDYAECSNCGANSGVQYDGVETIPFTTRYCHNCGARMVESEE